ncbi:unnamed protein product [Mytilus edulis]|uniref:C2H2-type domain-containing protein n=1 Tax=Mytilus edulis TaxID=6550 RepID=A0A8S3QTB8_MYTED|nr:unnamed protein product [Mytilus edulis]
MGLTGHSKEPPQQEDTPVVGEYCGENNHERTSKKSRRKNTDQECLRWAILSALHHEEVDKNCTKRVGQYKKWADEFNFDGIEFPVSLKAIDKFERQNTDLNINVFGFDGVKKGEDEEEDLQIYPLRISKNTGSRHVDLLFLTNESKQHYCWIKSLSRLLSCQISEHGHELFFCRRCLSHFSRQDILDEHMEYCSQKDAVRIEMPEEGTHMGLPQPC